MRPACRADQSVMNDVVDPGQASWGVTGEKRHILMTMRAPLQSPRASRR